MSGFCVERHDVTGLACLQASSMSKEAAESAQHRLRGLDAPYAQALAPKEPEKPSAAVLAQYGITPEFMDFVRSLTYSTFRDFPADALPAAKVIEPCILSQPRQQYATSSNILWHLCLQGNPAFQHCQSLVSSLAAELLQGCKPWLLVFDCASNMLLTAAANLAGIRRRGQISASRCHVSDTMAGKLCFLIPKQEWM